MKKILIILAIIILVLINTKSETIIIPDDSVRFRIVSASNTLEDLTIKSKLSVLLTDKINTILKNTKSKEEAIKALYTNKDDIDNYVNNYLVINKYSKPYKVSLGINKFPKKVYKGVEYKEGYYDSLVVTLGDAKGVNFWCAVYPPLCQISEENPQYTTLIKEILEKH